MPEAPHSLLCIEPRFPGGLGAVADSLVRQRGYCCQFFCADADGREHWPAAAGRSLDVILFNVGGVAREAPVFATVQPDGDIKDVTAAALQQPDGSWACKIGGMALIQVPSLESLRGPTYGLAVAGYERDVPVAPAPFGGR